MGHSSAVGLLVFVLFLFACVSGIAVADHGGQQTVISKDAAQQAVVAAQNSITEMSQKAQSNIDSATLLLTKVKAFKQQAAKAANEAQLAKGNKNAKTTVADVKRISDTVSSLYQTAITQLKSANTSMLQVLSEAKTMEDECNEIILTNDKTTADYTTENNQAVGIKTKADGLETNITAASTIISGVDSTAQQMEKSAEEAQLKNFHVSVIVSVANIENMIKEADGKIQETKKHKEAVNDIVNAMMNHCKKDIIESNEILKTQCQSADDALTSAKGAVTEAVKAGADIKQQKGLADTALANIKKPKIDMTTAEAEATAANTCVRTAGQHVVQLNSALETAKESVTKANDAKQKIKKALSTITTAPNTVQATETEKANPPVGQGTEPDQRDTTTQPTSKELPDQSNNSGEKLKDALIKDAQNVPTTALTGGKAPAPGAKNDSAMTVSVPLLVALIASAVLQ